VFLSAGVGVDNQTLPESADDRRANQLHHVSGRHLQPLLADRKSGKSRVLQQGGMDVGSRHTRNAPSTLA
ncbi:hypothetical protein, partial [Neoaquamicrobium sediminum]